MLGKSITDSVLTPHTGWEEFVSLCENSLCIEDKFDSEVYVAGEFTDGIRNTDNLVNRSAIVLDLDKGSFTFKEIITKLDSYLNSDYVTYSTYSNDDFQSKCRIVIPLENPVIAKHYRTLSKKIAMDLGVTDYCDPASFKPNQLMNLPSHSESNKDIVFFARGKKDKFLSYDILDSENENEPKSTTEKPNTVDNSFVNLLKNYPVNGLDYNDWLEVGLALYNYYSGSEEGLKLWVDWSKNDSNHPSDAEFTYKWNSMGSSYSGSKISIGTIIMRVKDKDYLKAINDVIDSDEVKVSNGDTVSNVINLNTAKKDIVKVLLDKAGSLMDYGEYDAFKNKMMKIPHGRITDDEYQMIASNVRNSVFGKTSGLTIPVIKKAIMPQKKANKTHTPINEVNIDKPSITEDGNLRNDKVPAWLADWIFISERNSFYNITSLSEVNQQAFNTMFMEMDNLIDDEGAPLTPVAYARQFQKIMVVCNKGFNPLKGHIYNDSDYLHDTSAERWMVNTYIKAGCAHRPLDSLNDKDRIDAEKYIRMFESHIVKLVGETDAWILMNWLAHNIKYPGKKIRWALVMAGGYGTGKTYIKKVLAKLLGSRYIGDLTNELISGKFSSWQTGNLVNVVEEVKMTGQDRYDNINKLKAVITNDDILIEAKGRDPYTARNFTNYMLLTNILSALPIDSDDRRYAVLSDEHKDLNNPLGISPLEYPDPAIYFNELYMGLEKFDGVLLDYFLNFEFDSRFCPDGVAPSTSSKDVMVSLSKSSVFTLFWDIYESHKCDVINDMIIDITHLKKIYNESDPDKDEQLPSANAIKNILMNENYRELKQRVYIGKNNSHRIWKRGNIKDEEVIAKVKDYFLKEEI